LTNKRVLITGGGGAIGAALCRRFARAGELDALVNNAGCGVSHRAGDLRVGQPDDGRLSNFRIEARRTKPVNFRTWRLFLGRQSAFWTNGAVSV
jgi:NAD(P)-dependent dehydrogenase (short-subunit alcohol dehydrogenase family)